MILLIIILLVVVKGCKKMKRKLVTLGLIATLALSATTTAYAKTGPDDYYDSYKSSGNLEVGDDIPPGEYVLFNKSDTRNATVSVRTDGKTVMSDTFWYNYIIDVEDGDRVYMANCYLVDMDEALVFTPEEGFFKVGEHLNPGTYYIEWLRGDDTGQATAYTHLYYTDDEEYKDSGEWKKTVNVSPSGSAEVTLEDGMYINLSGCRLVYDDKDDD